MTAGRRSPRAAPRTNRVRLMSRSDFNRVPGMVRTEHRLQEVSSDEEVSVVADDFQTTIAKQYLSLRNMGDNWTITFIAVLFVCLLSMTYVLVARGKVIEAQQEVAQLRAQNQALMEKNERIERQRRGLLRAVDRVRAETSSIPDVSTDLPVFPPKQPLDQFNSER